MRVETETRPLTSSRIDVLYVQQPSLKLRQKIPAVVFEGDAAGSNGLIVWRGSVIAVGIVISEGTIRLRKMSEEVFQLTNEKGVLGFQLGVKKTSLKVVQTLELVEKAPCRVQDAEISCLGFAAPTLIGAINFECREIPRSVSQVFQSNKEIIRQTADSVKISSLGKEHLFPVSPFLRCVSGRRLAHSDCGCENSEDPSEQRLVLSDELAPEIIFATKDRGQKETDDCRPRRRPNDMPLVCQEASLRPIKLRASSSHVSRSSERASPAPSTKPEDAR